MAGVDYANARVHAMRVGLLGRAGIRALLALPSAEERMAELLRGGWGEAIAVEARRERDPLRAIERGLRAAVQEDARRLDRFLEGTRAQPLLRALLLPEDAWNLKAVFRGLAHQTPPDAVLPLLAPTPSLPESALRELAGSGTVHEAAERLATWRHPWAGAIAAAIPGWAKTRDLVPLESAIEAAAWRDALGAAGGISEDAGVVRRHLRRAIDVANARSALAGARGPGVRLPGGRIDPARLDAVAGKPAPERPGALGAILGLPAKELADPFRAEERLRASVETAMRREARVRPLSLALALSWLLDRRAEARHLRVALEGAAFGLPLAELAPLLEAA